MSGLSGRCPSCGGELHGTSRGDVAFRRCLSCGSALLDAAVLDRLLPPTSPPGPRHEAHGYPVHYPQDDHGHTSGRPRPTFAPSWSSSADAPDATWLMFGR